MLYTEAAGAQSWMGVKNAYVTVLLEVDNIWYNEGESSICGYHDGSLNQFYTLIKCNPTMSGQFVQLQLITKVSLNLYEVEVWSW